MSGKQIKLFLVDGTPGGLTTAEITNWTGHVFSARRSGLADLLKREEAQRTGVYFLLGGDETTLGDARCYIGEADVVRDRLRNHHREKEFWDRVVVITSKDTNLTKSHGRYLEARLISLAAQAARVTLENGTAPPVPALPEADTSDMDYFLAQLQIVLPVLGVNAIRIRPRRSVPDSAATSAESPVSPARNSALMHGHSRLTASSLCLSVRWWCQRGMVLAERTAPLRLTPRTAPSTNALSATAPS